MTIVLVKRKNLDSIQSARYSQDFRSTVVNFESSNIDFWALMESLARPPYLHKTLFYDWPNLRLERSKDVRQVRRLLVWLIRDKLINKFIAWGPMFMFVFHSFLVQLLPPIASGYFQYYMSKYLQILLILLWRFCKCNQESRGHLEKKRSNFQG